MPQRRSRASSAPRPHRPRTVNEQWPCVFHDGLTRSVDDQIQRDWKERLGEGAPFGSLRKSWRELHCQTLNPYGSDQCPYRPEDCALSFLIVAQRAVATADDPRVYFRKLCQSYATTRADNKPAARDTPAPAAAILAHITGNEGPGDPEGRPRGVVLDRDGNVIPGVAPLSDPHLRRRLAPPVAVGSLLGISNGGPRPEAGRVEGEGPE